MWTRDELQEIRNRALLEGETPKQTKEWINACVQLAFAADKLDLLTDEIEKGKKRAVCD